MQTHIGNKYKPYEFIWNAYLPPLPSPLFFWFSNLTFCNMNTHKQELEEEEEENEDALSSSPPDASTLLLITLTMCTIS